MRTLSGRKRKWNREPPVTELYNTPVQGTAVDIVKAALGSLVKALDGKDFRIIACVHDEIILEAPEDQAEEALSLLKSVMETAGNRFLKQVPVLAEPAIVNSWAEK